MVSELSRLSVAEKPARENLRAAMPIDWVDVEVFRSVPSSLSYALRWPRRRGGLQAANPVSRHEFAPLTHR
jgi:hypothetical protein